MKLIKIPFIIAFAIAASAIGIAYLSGIRNVAEPRDYLWYDTLQSLGELCRTKYHHSRHYTACAQQAERDSLRREAALFRALAFADEVHCKACQRAIESLGGIYHSPVATTAETLSTRDNLHHALTNKQTLHKEIIGRCLSHAIDDGNRYVARIVTWCDASDIAQMHLLQHLLSEANPDDCATYHVCPTCGAISCDRLQTAYCPHCMTSTEKFQLFTEHSSSSH